MPPDEILVDRTAMESVCSDADFRLDILDDDELPYALLAALVAMARKNARFQADVDAAVKRRGILASPGRLKQALTCLKDAKLLERLIPLYDGGMLVTPTNAAMDTIGGGLSWLSANYPGQTIKTDSRPRVNDFFSRDLLQGKQARSVGS